VVTGGGYEIIGDALFDDIAIHRNDPIVEEGPGLRQWFVQGDSIGGGAPGDDWALEATAVCVKA
jgi:hypothetical protein